MYVLVIMFYMYPLLIVYVLLVLNQPGYQFWLFLDLELQGIRKSRNQNIRTSEFKKSEIKTCQEMRYRYMYEIYIHVLCTYISYIMYMHIPGDEDLRIRRWGSENPEMGIWESGAKVRIWFQIFAKISAFGEIFKNSINFSITALKKCRKSEVMLLLMFLLHRNSIFITKINEIMKKMKYTWACLPATSRPSSPRECSWEREGPGVFWINVETN